MYGLKSIELAVEHAKLKRDATVKVHAQTQRRLADAEVQLHQLQSYADDTDAKWVTSAVMAYTAEVMLHHHQFAGRLRQAIGMQTDVIAGLHQAVADAHAIVLHAEFRLAAIQKLFESRQQQLMLLRARRDQAQSDELATIQFLRNRKSNTLGVQHDT